MTDKYRVVCRECLKLFGIFDTPKVEMPSVCDDCGSQQIATERFSTEGEIEQLDFDVLIVNKKTNVSKRCGFFISKEKVEKDGKDLNKMRKLLATEIATSLHTVIKSDTLIVDLLKQN